MSNIPEGLFYTKDHEWALIEGSTATVGISDFAQHALGDVVYIDLPKLGIKVFQHKVAGTIESVKSVSDIFSPLGGKISAVNDAINKSPETVNKEPYSGGWLFKLTEVDSAETKNLLSASGYKTFLATL